MEKSPINRLIEQEFPLSMNRTSFDQSINRGKEPECKQKLLDRQSQNPAITSSLRVKTALAIISRVFFRCAVGIRIEL
jgi:hypothetical protein